MYEEKLNLFIWIAFLASLIILMVKNRLKNKALLILLALAIIIAPFGLGILFPGLPIRSLGGIPIMIGAAGYFTILAIDLIFKSVYNQKIRRHIVWIITIVFMLVSYNFFYMLNLNFYGNHIRYIRDEAFANMLATDIINELDDVSPDKPIVILGRHPALPSDQISKSLNTGSLFGFDLIPIRSASLMRYLGYDFIVPNYEQSADAEKYFDDMAIWPKDGSIIETDEYIVVKISE
jgi:hypothetical protein